MAKIQDIGTGNYIRDPRGVKTTDGRGMNIRVLKVQANDGNSFRCHPIKSIRGSTVEIDTENFIQIPIDTQVEPVTI